MTLTREHVARDGFRLRGTKMSRVDGFSDVVFGFALTLLVVSLEVPKTFAELSAVVSGFVPFAISFLFLMMIWHAHYTFFRRYGLEDQTTIVLNAVLLFVVLFYVYPLKFLFSGMLGGVLRGERAEQFTAARQIPELMVLYGVGFAAIYLLLAAMYWHAWRERGALKLNALEQLLTKGTLVDLALEGGVALLACVVALLLPPEKAGVSGYVYFLIAGTKTGVLTWVGRRTRQMGAAVSADRISAGE